MVDLKHCPRLQKRGNSIIQITTNTGLAFRDICRLLSPGTNLASFGKLFDLEVKKASFPFSYLTSVKILDEPRLPNDLAIWKSELTSSKNATEADVREAQRLFEAAECKNIGEYLVVYLKRDVEILFRAAQLWRKKLREIVKVDFIECECFTISSLSNLAVYKSLIERKFVGLFSCNNSQNYRLLRSAVRGGICQVII